MNGILIIAHAPLAHALRSCAVHVFPDCEEALAAIDVQPNLPPEETLATARIAIDQLMRSGRHQGVLVLTDIFGATPSNVAQKLVDGVTVAAHHGGEPAHAAAQRELPARVAGRPRVARRRRRHARRDAGRGHRSPEPATKTP